MTEWQSIPLRRTPVILIT